MTSSLRTDLWQIKFRKEEDFGVEATDITENGDMIGVIYDFTPPDSNRQFMSVRTARPPEFLPPIPIYENYRSSYIRDINAVYPKNYEMSGSITGAYLTNSLILKYAMGQFYDEKIGTKFRHTIVGSLQIPSFTMEVSYYNTDKTSNNNLWVRYIGCKIDSLEIYCDEGDAIKFNAKIIAQDIRHNINEVAGSDSQKEWLGYKQELESNEYSQPKDFTFNQDLYFFSAGNLLIYEPDGGNQPEGSINNTTYSRIKNFRLTINNHIKPHYHIKRSAFGTPTISELVESDKDYGLKISIYPDDQDIFRLLMQNGYFGGERRGYGIKIRFDRPVTSLFEGDDYIEFRMPASTSISRRRWSATPFNYYSTNPQGPISGHESVNSVIGCFLRSAPHIRNYNNSLIQADLDFLVPSLEIECQDGYKEKPKKLESFTIPVSLDLPLWLVYNDPNDTWTSTPTDDYLNTLKSYSPWAVYMLNDATSAGGMTDGSGNNRNGTYQNSYGGDSVMFHKTSMIANVSYSTFFERNLPVPSGNIYTSSKPFNSNTMSATGWFTIETDASLYNNGAWRNAFWKNHTLFSFYDGSGNAIVFFANRYNTQHMCMDIYNSNVLVWRTEHGDGTGNRWVVNRNQTMFFAVTMDGSSIKIYVNGELAVSGSGSANINFNFTNSWIGRNMYTGDTNPSTGEFNDFFEGRIQGMAFYDKVLTQQEISDILAAGI